MFKIRQFLPLCSNCFKRGCRTHMVPTSRPFSSARNKQVEDTDNAPIKYSTSPASKYKAKSTRTGIEEERLWYEPYVIIASFSVFLIYFCVLREENDIDKELGRSLYSRIEGLEETQLRISLKHNLNKGLDTRDIVKRLQEIEAERRELTVDSE